MNDDIERRLRDDAAAVERQLSTHVAPPAPAPRAVGRRVLVALATLAAAASIVGVLLVANGSEDRLVPAEAPTIPSVAPTPPTSAQPAPTTGRLRITQQRASWESGGSEGQISYLVVRGPEGQEVAARSFQALALTTPVLDLALAPGRYEVESYQRTCVETCSTALDAPSDRCTARFDVIAGSASFVNADVSGRARCSLRTTTAPPASPIPDEFALRQPYRTCGDVFPMEPRSPRGQSARRCLLRSHRDNRTAELWERSSWGEGSDYLQQIYRTEPDGTIVVFLPGREDDGATPWLRYTCGSLVEDDDAVFTPTDCAEPRQVGAQHSTGSTSPTSRDAQPQVVARFTVEVDFVETGTTHCPVTEMRFVDHSSGDPTTWRWTFPDGSMATEQNPRVPAVGIGEVTLHVSNATSTDEVTEFVNYPVC